MACEAAIKHARRVLDGSVLSMTAAEVRDEIGWWTPETIAEALEALAAARAVLKVDGRYHPLPRG